MYSYILPYNNKLFFKQISKEWEYSSVVEKSLVYKRV